MLTLLQALPLHLGAMCGTLRGCCMSSPAPSARSRFGSHTSAAAPGRERGAPGAEGKAEGNAIGGEKWLWDKGVNLLLQVALPVGVLEAPYRRRESSSWLRSPRAYRVLVAGRAPLRQYPLTTACSHSSPSHPFSPFGSASQRSSCPIRQAQPCTREAFSPAPRDKRHLSSPSSATRLCHAQGTGFVPPSLSASK